MDKKFYRFTVQGKGIYEAVDADCPKDDPRREEKPDGSWLKKVGPDFPRAISFWTEVGLQKYTDSGLRAWHAAVVNGPVVVEEIARPEKVLYEDEYQIIVRGEGDSS